MASSLYAGHSPLPFDAAAAVLHLHAKDKVLSKLITRVGPFALKIEDGHPPFQALTESILHQQVTGKAAAAILGRFCATFGVGKRFPKPERVVTATDEQLRAVGISRSKAAALRDLAAKTLDGTVPTAKALHGMHEDEIIERLTAVRGIGVWTVHMLLMFRLGRPDILPVGDYGVRKGFKKTFRSKNELPTPGEIAKRAERWRPYRTVASWYMWRALEIT
jgi:3-methyladenine DNA glycosylase/8-oxoguanine DNA glycosylase